MTLILCVVLIALAFEYVNGFHDTANAIATSVSTRVMTPRQAIILSSTFNLFGAMAFTAVAKTIGKGLVETDYITINTVMCALIGAILWNLLTWWLALPTSSSHALIGAYAGAAVAKGGMAAVLCESCTGWPKILTFIVLSPLIGLLIGHFLMVAILWVFRNTSPRRVDHWFRRAQLASAAWFSLNHGGNDAQKTAGIITAVLFSANYIPTFEVPMWVRMAAYIAIGLGTLAGGWRIIHTMGSKITKLQPVGGFAAETGAAMAIFTATHFGIPVSTTHAITGSIVGVGAVQRLSAVRWGIATKIVWAWVITIPAAGGIAALTYEILLLFDLH